MKRKYEQPRLEHLKLERTREKIRTLSLAVQKELKNNNPHISAGITQEITYALEDLSHCLLNDFPLWLELQKGRRPDEINKSIAFLLYNCGVLAPYSNYNLPAYLFNTLCQHLGTQPISDAGTIMKSIYSAGLTFKALKFRGKLWASAIEPLLAQLLTVPRLAPIDIINCLFTIGAYGKYVEGEFNACIIEDCLKSLATCSELRGKDVAMAIFYVGCLADTRSLEGQLGFPTLLAFFKALPSNFNDQDIRQIFSGIILLTQAGAFKGYISAADLNVLLESLLHLKEISFESINGYISCLANLAKSGYLSEPIDVSIIHLLFEKQLQFHSRNLHSISEIILYVGNLVNEDKLKGNLHSGVMEELLTQIPGMHISSSNHISEILAGLGMLAKKESTMLTQIPAIPENLTYLVKRLFEQNIPISVAEQAFSGIVNLWPLIKLDAQELKTLMQCIIRNKSYLHPNDLVTYINYFAHYNQHHAQLSELFINLVNSITFSLSYLTIQSQESLLRSISLLEQNKECNWAFLLKRKLKLEKPQSAAAIEPTQRSQQRIVTRPAIVQDTHMDELSETEEPTTRPEPPPGAQRMVQRPAIARQEVPNEVSDESQEEESSFSEAYSHNRLFRALANKNISQLEQLLGVNLRVAALNKQSTSSHEQTGSSHSHSIVHPQEEIVIELLQNTDASALRLLIKGSNAWCIELLLRACSHHVRYQLAIKNSLHPIILYLALDELKEHTVDLLRLEIYRDSKALFNLVDAMEIRALQNPEEKTVIRDLQNQVLNRSLEFHQKTKHHNVIAHIRTKRAKINSTLGELGQGPTQSHNNTTPAATVRGFFPAARPEQANTAYEYSIADVQLILPLRLKSLSIPGLSVLNTVTTGNSVGNSLSHYLSEINLQQILEAGGLNLVIPIKDNLSWSAIHLELKKDEAPKIVYYSNNPIPNEERHIGLLLEIKRVLNEHHIARNPSLTQFMPRFNSPSIINEAAFLIEHIYCDLKQQPWLIQDHDLLNKVIRQRHLRLLQEQNPEAYRAFYARQESHLVEGAQMEL